MTRIDILVSRDRVAVRDAGERWITVKSRGPDSGSSHSGGTGEREPNGAGKRDPDTEAGPDGTRQTLIEGVKPVTNKERLDVAAGKPLHGGFEPMDVGMFGGPRNRDMFDAWPFKAGARR